MKPILFSTPMVQAILRGRKTMTRRVISDKDITNQFDIDVDGKVIAYIDQETGDSLKPTIRCPYTIGDIMWVRETWFENSPNGLTRYFYRADADEDIVLQAKALGYKWRPSIFMPKEACRIFLRVIGVRAERLQELSWDDAIKEGVPRRTEYIVLWNHLNGKRGFGWDRNPWVWVIEFERCEKSEDTP
jgi:hypothetical protein